ncbi:MAG: deoxyribose-phosphate aldolase [Bacteroidota bacterium]
MTTILPTIEHTSLAPLITYQQVEQLIKEVKKYPLRGVCIPPYWVKKVKRELGDTSLKVVTVVGFPLGYQRTATKRQELQTAIADGADEVDIVMCLSAFKSGAYDWVKIEFAQLTKLAHEYEKLVKVIIETAYLDDTEIEKACQLCTQAGVDFIKTSTGFAPSGAQAKQVAYIKSLLPDYVGIKASGGIKTAAQAQAMLEAGAEIIGTSSGIAIAEALSANH